MELIINKMQKDVQELKGMTKELQVLKEQEIKNYNKIPSLLNKMDGENE
jgi:hypothetical protein